MKEHNLKMCRGGSVARRLLPLFICFLVSTAFALAPTSSLKTCGTAADANDRDGSSWVNPTNAQGANDGVYATAQLINTSQCDHLNCTNYSFTSSDVPVGATINGVEVVVRNKVSLTTGAPVLASIQLIKGGTLQGTDLGPGSTLTTSDRDDTYGATNNLWGLALSQSDVTASNFGNGFFFSTALGTLHTFSVDSSQMRITYTAAATTSHKALLLLGVGLVIPGGPMFVPLPPLPQTTSWHRPNAYAL